MGDGWDDAAKNPLMNVLQASATGVKFVDCINTDGKIKSAEYIADLFIKQIEELGPEHVVQVWYFSKFHIAFDCLVCSCPTPYNLLHKKW
jgi:hypothetical protein